MMHSFVYTKRDASCAKNRKENVREKFKYCLLFHRRTHKVGILAGLTIFKNYKMQFLHLQGVRRVGISDAVLTRTSDEA